MNKLNVSGMRISTARGIRMRTLLLLTILYAFAMTASAAASGTLPWEKPMTAIATSLTGPVAYAIGLIGIAIAGGAMLWGGELTEFGTAGLHDRLGGLRPCIRRADAVQCIRRLGGSDLKEVIQKLWTQPINPERS